MIITVPIPEGVVVRVDSPSRSSHGLTGRIVGFDKSDGKFRVQLIEGRHVKRTSRNVDDSMVIAAGDVGLYSLMELVPILLPSGAKIVGA